MANEIVWYDSSETGAPTLNNAAGSLDSVLYACLVTGFNSQTLTSVTVTSGVAAVVKAGHGFADGRMIEIAGAGTSAINGRKKITVTGSGAFTFPAPGVPDGAISGTITAKRSPLGWTREVNSGNVSIYARTDVTATAMKLRVDDSGTGVAAATYARMRMIESYSDINTLTNPAPPASALGGGGVYIQKGANDTSAKKWVLVGDSRTFYLFTESATFSAASAGGAMAGIYGFGDALRVASGDSYCCFVAGGSDSGTGSTSDFGGGQVLGASSTNDSFWWQRASTGVGAPVRGWMHGGASVRQIGGQGPTYPSPVDNGMVVQQQVLLLEDNVTFNYPIRGVARGMADPLAALVTGSSSAPAWDRQILSGLIGSSRDYLVVTNRRSGSYGAALFDITGPWA